MKVLGIDIGGTGIKGAVVDTKRGVLKSDRLRILTPHPATPEAVAEVVAKIVDHFEWEGPVGAAFPGVVHEGTIRTSANLDDSWIGESAVDVFTKATGAPLITVVNDADAAGEAEATFGAAKGRKGVVLVATLGTGIGSALFVHGKLAPNTELGHLPLHGDDAERYAAESVRETQALGWEEWAGRVTEYLRMVEDLLWPELIVLGGGVSKSGDKFIPLLDVRTKVVAADLRNKAGIIGAAEVARRAAVKAKESGSKLKRRR